MYHDNEKDGKKYTTKMRIWEEIYQGRETGNVRTLDFLKSSKTTKKHFALAHVGLNQGRFKVQTRWTLIQFD
jgi:hypothetical protein